MNQVQQEESQSTKENIFLKENPSTEVLYSSTRGKGDTVRASQAILKGLSEDGGLFVPDHIPLVI